MLDGMFFEDTNVTGSQYGAEEGLPFGLKGDCTSQMSDSDDGSEIDLRPSASSMVTDKAPSEPSAPTPKTQPVGFAAKFAASVEVGNPFCQNSQRGWSFY